MWAFEGDFFLTQEYWTYVVLKMYGRTLQSTESLIQSKTGLIESKHVLFTKVVRRLLSTEVMSQVSKRPK